MTNAGAIGRSPRTSSSRSRGNEEQIRHTKESLSRAEEEIRALWTELEKVESGKGRGFDPLMSSARVPALGTEYLRKLRELKYNETLYELLVKQYEVAKLDEARDAVVIQVIDRAVPPERKSDRKGLGSSYWRP